MPVYTNSLIMCEELTQKITKKIAEIPSNAEMLSITSTI